MRFLIPDKYKGAAGVYIIRNTLNSKVYVGSTQVLIRRYNDHLLALKGGTHHADRLQNFVNQYNTDVLRFELLQLVTPGQDLGLAEYEWICATNATIPDYGFNTQEVPMMRLAEAPKGKIEVDFPIGAFSRINELAELHGISAQELILRLVTDGVNSMATSLAKVENKRTRAWSKFDEATMTQIEQHMAASMPIHEIATATGLSERSVNRYKILLLGPYGYDKDMRQARCQAGRALARAQGKSLGRPAGANQEKMAAVKSCVENGLSLNNIAAATGISKTTVKRYKRLLDN